MLNRHCPGIFPFLLLMTLISGCAGARAVAIPASGASQPDGSESSRPPVSDQSRSLREPESPYRTVVPGDTLYSIAWESGQDYRQLAAWNRIRSPYVIKPGQQLRVQPPEASAAAPVRKDSKPVAASSTSKRSATTAKPQTAKAAKSVPPARPATSARAPAIRNAKPPERKPDSTPARSRMGSGPVGSWAWPADGQILNRYAESDSKGLDIAGARGAMIRAAANGRVVYQGSGLRGYGQLIIIKHSEDYLSAYAHNEKIFVKEGDAVKRGQKIAEMGSTGTDRVKLHFEIRRQGVPIDPMKYLPRR